MHKYAMQGGRVWPFKL